MAIEYVFDDGKYSVSVRDLKATVFDIVASAASKADELQTRASSEEDKDLQTKLLKLSSLFDSCSRDIYKATSSLVGSLQKLDSYTEELKKFDSTDAKESVIETKSKVDNDVVSSDNENQDAIMETNTVPNIVSTDISADLIPTTEEYNTVELPQIIPENVDIETNPENANDMYVAPAIEEKKEPDVLNPVQENAMSFDTNQPSSIIVSKDATFPDRAILVTKVQGTKLRNSLESQKVFVHRENFEDNVELPASNDMIAPLIDDKKKIEDLLEQAKLLYDQGKRSEAQALYDEISKLNSKSN